ncbi:MAG: YdiL family protein [Burkholderiales bacterium]|nr:YdiL family protein [Burkholderiales bacterium]
MKKPKPEQIIAARHSVGHTQTEAAHTIFSALRTWQNWEAGSREMPRSAFVLYLILTEQITVDEARQLKVRD